MLCQYCGDGFAPNGLPLHESTCSINKHEQLRVMTCQQRLTKIMPSPMDRHCHRSKFAVDPSLNIGPTPASTTSGACAGAFTDARCDEERDVSVKSRYASRQANEFMGPQLW